MDLGLFFASGSILRFWPRHKNGRFSVPTLRIGSVLSRDYFLGDPDHLTKFHPKKLKNRGTFPSVVGIGQNRQNFALRQISLKRSLYVKNWRKRIAFFFFNFGHGWGPPNIKMSFLGHFLAQISFLGIYLWNGRTMSINEEMRTTFFLIWVQG